MTEENDKIINKPAKSSKFARNKNTDYKKGIFAHYHDKMRNEIEFSETDFYEDNIYDEPEYWRMPHFTESNKNRHDARP